MSNKPVIVSIVSTKGGVGKTTLTANLAGLLADLGLKVLAIDADMQPSLSKYFKLETNPTSGLAEVLSRGGVVTEQDLVQTSIPNLKIIVSNMTDATQAWIKTRVDSLILLKSAVQSPIIEENFDVILIDTQGAKGELQRTAAMACDFMISPFVPDMINYTEFFAGTLDMLETLNAFSRYSSELKAGELKVVINNMERTRNSKEILDIFQEQIALSSNPVKVLDTVIHKADAMKTARSFQQPVHIFDSNSAKFGKSALVMIDLITEIFPALKATTEAFIAQKGAVNE